MTATAVDKVRQREVDEDLGSVPQFQRGRNSTHINWPVKEDL